VSWLWPERIGFGKLLFLDGDPDLGKSLIALGLCARLSTGRPFPGGSPRPPSVGRPGITSPIVPFTRRCPMFDPRKHNYYRKLIELFEQGKLPCSRLSEVDVYHDDWCRIHQGGYSNCHLEFAVRTDPPLH